jgi:hypothetical protein
MKVNVWQRKDHGVSHGDISITTPNSYGDIWQKERPESWVFLGTTELTLDLPKKEVEKVVRATIIGTTTNYAGGSITNSHTTVQGNLPIDAYDITVHYKVKE